MFRNTLENTLNVNQSSQENQSHYCRIKINKSEKLTFVLEGFL